MNVVVLDATWPAFCVADDARDKAIGPQLTFARLERERHHGDLRSGLRLNLAGVSQTPGTLDAGIPSFVRFGQNREGRRKGMPSESFACVANDFTLCVDGEGG